jgi:hypothetical protein
LLQTIARQRGADLARARFRRRLREPGTLAPMQPTLVHCRSAAIQRGASDNSVAVRLRQAIPVIFVSVATLTGCGGGGKTPTTSTPPSKPVKSEFAPPVSNAELLRRLPASCRRQLLDPRMPVSIRNRMWRSYRRRLTLNPRAGQGMMCGSISGNFSGG